MSNPPSSHHSTDEHRTSSCISIHSECCSNEHRTPRQQRNYKETTIPVRLCIADKSLVSLSTARYGEDQWVIPRQNPRDDGNVTNTNMRHQQQYRLVQVGNETRDPNQSIAVSGNKLWYNMKIEKQNNPVQHRVGCDFLSGETAKYEDFDVQRLMDQNIRMINEIERLEGENNKAMLQIDELKADNKLLYATVHKLLDHHSERDQKLIASLQEKSKTLNRKIPENMEKQLDSLDTSAMCMGVASVRYVFGKEGKYHLIDHQESTCADDDKMRNGDYISNHGEESHKSTKHDGIVRETSYNRFERRMAELKTRFSNVASQSRELDKDEPLSIEASCKYI